MLTRTSLLVPSRRTRNVNETIGRSYISYFRPLSCDVDKGRGGGGDWESLGREGFEMARIYSIFAIGTGKEEGRMRQSRLFDSMFSAEKVGSRAESWPGLAVYHTSC